MTTLIENLVKNRSKENLQQAHEDGFEHSRFKDDDTYDEKENSHPKGTPLHNSWKNGFHAGRGYWHGAAIGNSENPHNVGSEEHKHWQKGNKIGMKEFNAAEKIRKREELRDSKRK